jgi:hypothetical protein
LGAARDQRLAQLGTGPPGVGIANWIHVTTGPEGFVYVAYLRLRQLHACFTRRTRARRSTSWTPIRSTGATTSRFNNDGGSAAPPAGGKLLGLHGSARRSVVRSSPTRSLPGTLYVAEPIGFYDEHGFEIDCRRLHVRAFHGQRPALGTMHVDGARCGRSTMTISNTNRPAIGRT